MSLADLRGTVDRALLAAGTATYDCHDYKTLTKVPEALQAVVETLRGLGFSTVARFPGYHVDPAVKRLRTAVQKAVAASPVVVVYYTGHGAHPERGPYYLVTKKSRPADLGGTAEPAADLLQLLTRRDHGEVAADQPTVLVILDCCFSGGAGMEMLGDALRGIGNPNTWVIASAGALEYAQQGLFAEAFCDALRRPATGPSQRFVSLDWIVQAVNDAHAGLAQQQARLFPPATGSTGIPPFFPNPCHQPGLAGLTVADQHWLSRVRGGPEESTTGFYLTGKTGRLRAAEHLAAWMTDPGAKGLAVVTGSPGTGKSALLALPVLLSDRFRRADLLRAADPGSLIQRTAGLLPAGTPVTAIHARGLNTDQAAGAIARALGREASTASALLEDLDTTPEHGRRIVIIDAVDEATSPATLLGGLLVPLARQPSLQVAVGARRHVLSTVGDAGLTIDLDTSEYRDPQALTDYVHRLLIASEEPGVTTAYTPVAAATRGGRGEAAGAVAAVIAQRATAREGTSESFLIGRLLALSARGRSEPADITSEGWQLELPASLAEAFDEDLARLGNQEPLARALLTALAWARGPGLPWENIWVPVARALVRRDGGTGHPPITGEDVRWLLGEAGAYVIEDLGPGGRSVYRPFHDLLAAHLRGEPGTGHDGRDPAATAAWQQRRAVTEHVITGALLATVPAGRQGQRDWPTAHPYVRTYLAQHAAAAGPGALAALVQDADFLAAADPVALSPLLSFTVAELRNVARIYRRARPLLGDDLQANAAYLQEAARALTGTAAEGTGIRPLYRTHLASARRDDSLLTLTGHTGPVESVAFGTGPDGRLLLASGSRDKTVRLWDPVTGAPAGQPLAGLTGPVGSVAFGAGPAGRLLLASGSWDGTVRLWDPVTGAPAGQPLTGHTGPVGSVAFGAGADGRLLLASGSRDGTVRLWDPVTGAPAGQPLAGHTGPVGSVAFGTGPDGRLLLASGSYDQDGAAVGPGYRCPGRPAARRPHRAGGLGGVRDRPGRPAAAGLRQLRPDGAAVGPGYRCPGRPAARRPHRAGGLGGVRDRPGRPSAAGLRQLGRDGAVVGPGRRCPGRPAARRPHGPGGIGGVRDRRRRPLAAGLRQLGRDGAAVGPGRRCPGRPAARRPHGPGGIGGVRDRRRCPAAAGLRRLRPDGAAVGPGRRCPGRPAARRPHELCVLGGVRDRPGCPAAAGLRQLGRDGAAVGPGRRCPGRPAARRPHGPGGIGGVRDRPRWPAAAGLRRLRPDGAAVGPGCRRPGRPAARRPHGAGVLGGVRDRPRWPPAAGLRQLRRDGAGVGPGRRRSGRPAARRRNEPGGIGGVRDRRGWPPAAGLRRPRPDGAAVGPSDEGVHRNASAQVSRPLNRSCGPRAGDRRRRGHQCDRVGRTSSTMTRVRAKYSRRDRSTASAEGVRHISAGGGSGRGGRRRRAG